MNQRIQPTQDQTEKLIAAICYRVDDIQKPKNRTIFSQSDTLTSIIERKEQTTLKVKPFAAGDTDSAHIDYHAGFVLYGDLNKISGESSIPEVFAFCEQIDGKNSWRWPKAGETYDGPIKDELREWAIDTGVWEVEE